MKKLLALIAAASLAGVFGLMNVAVADHHEKDEDKAEEEKEGYKDAEEEKEMEKEEEKDDEGDDG